MHFIGAVNFLIVVHGLHPKSAGISKFLYFGFEE